MYSHLKGCEEGIRGPATKEKVWDLVRWQYVLGHVCHYHIVYLDISRNRYSGLTELEEAPNIIKY